MSGYIAGVATARLAQFAHDADVLKCFLKKEGRNYLKLTFRSWVSRKHEPSNKETNSFSNARLLPKYAF